MSNNYEECDAKCGQTGVQVQKFYCEKLFQNNGTYEPASARYCEHLIKPNITRPCNGKECATKERYMWYFIIAFCLITTCLKLSVKNKPVLYKINIEKGGNV